MIIRTAFGATFYVVLLLFVFSTGYSQSFKDKLYLTNGSLVIGEIQSVDSTSQKISMVISENFTISIPFSQIESTHVAKRLERKEWLKTLPKLNQFNENGFFNAAYVNLLWGRDNSFASVDGTFSFELMYGYAFSQWIQLAGGLGVDLNEMVNTYPVFLHLSGDLNRRLVKPYYFISAGYGFAWQDETDQFGTREETSGGFFLNPGLGLRFKVQSVDMMVGVGYRRQNISTTLEETPCEFCPPSGFSQIRDRTINRFNLKLGVRF
ncbi:MAG: hypothetical protein AAFX87_01080 [Bacteroidota bacterium]